MFQKNNTMRRIPEGSVISQDPEPGSKSRKRHENHGGYFEGTRGTSTKRSTSWKLQYHITLWLKVLRKSYVSQVGDMNHDISDTSL